MRWLCGTFILLSWIGREQRVGCLCRDTPLRHDVLWLHYRVPLRLAMRVFCHVESSLWMMLQALETPK